MALDACHFRGMPQAVNGASSSCDRSSVRNGRDSCGTAVASSVQADSISATPSVAAILHRDLKPENVFLDGNNNIKLGDFGLSKQIAAQAFTNTYVGTPYYMSPELATGGQYDSKSDIWALGCITYELCALA